MSFMPGHTQLLSELTVLLKDVNWYLLGTHLHVPPDKLNAIKQEQIDTAIKLVQVLQYWLSNEEMSWEKITEALKKIGGYGNVIGIIESKYTAPGNFLTYATMTKANSGCIHIRYFLTMIYFKAPFDGIIIQRGLDFKGNI